MFATILAYLIVIILLKRSITSIMSSLSAVRPMASARLHRKDGSWAMITGCTQGIGLSYAKQLYRLGYNLLLLSRDQQKLLKVKNEIHSIYGDKQPIETLEVDFCDTHDVNYGRIETAIKRLDDNIAVVVNNVGMIYPDCKPERLSRLSDMERVATDLVSVNILCHVKNTGLALPSLLTNGSGLVINISSIGALFASPLFSLYSASKAFIDHFSRGLRAECVAKGVTVQSVLPGYVSTRMSRHMRPRVHAPTADQYVENAILIGEDSDRTTGFWSHQLIYHSLQVLSFISLLIGIDLMRKTALKSSTKTKILIETRLKSKQ